MKGFPNQIADLQKLALGLACIERLLARGDNPRDDGVFGEALVRDGVLGTGHAPRPVEEYLRDQMRKRIERQSFRTSARGLRELYRLLGLIDDSHGRPSLTAAGRQGAAFAGQRLAGEHLEF